MRAAAGIPVPRSDGEQQGSGAASGVKSYLFHFGFLQWENYQSTPLTFQVAVTGKACTHAETHSCSPPGCREGATGFLSLTGGRESRSLTAPSTRLRTYFCTSFLSGKGNVGL